MIRTSHIGFIFFLAAMVMTAEADVMRITGDRVCLRAAAKSDAEVVYQANTGTLLEAIDGISEEWVRVEPPKAADLWIFAELTKDSVVSVSKAHVRAGAGLNFNVVGTLPRGTRITSRGQTGDWIKIEPPPGTYLFVNHSFLEFVSKSEKKIAPVFIPEIPKAETIAEPIRTAVVRPVVQPVIPEPLPASTLAQPSSPVKTISAQPKSEVPTEKSSPKTSIWALFHPGKKTQQASEPEVYKSQVANGLNAPSASSSSWETTAPVKSESKTEVLPTKKLSTTQTVKPVVKPKPTVPPKPKYHEKYFSDDQLAPNYMQGKKGSFEGQLSKSAALLFSPTKFRLAKLDNSGRAITVCHVAGDNLKLTDFLGDRIKIEGRIYWLRSSSYPAIIVDKITKLP